MFCSSSKKQSGLTDTISLEWGREGHEYMKVPKLNFCDLPPIALHNPDFSWPYLEENDWLFSKKYNVD